jgi:hypothetical protein
MQRRTFLLAAVAAPSLVAVLSACGDPDAAPGDTAPRSVPPTAGSTSTVPGSVAPGSGQAIIYPTGADDVVVRVAQVGGFVPVGATFVQVPDVLITGDGRLFQPGAQTLQYPGPLLPVISVGSITPTGIGRLLAVAEANGLLAEPVPEYAPNTRVADAPATIVEFQADGAHVTHQADALGFVQDGHGDPAKELTPQRSNLLTFVNAARNLPTTVGADQLGPDEIWQPAAYRIQARVADPTTITSDGSGEPQPTVVPWPAASGARLADASECAIGSGEELTAALTAATTLTFFTEDGVTYQVSAVGQLPGTGC